LKKALVPAGKGMGQELLVNKLISSVLCVDIGDDIKNYTILLIFPNCFCFAVFFQPFSAILFLDSELQ
jgi:hypothetical protein